MHVHVKILSAGNRKVGHPHHLWTRMKSSTGGGDSSNGQSSAQKVLNDLLARLPELVAVYVTDKDGVVLLLAAAPRSAC